MFIRRRRTTQRRKTVRRRTSRRVSRGRKNVGYRRGYPHLAPPMKMKSAGFPPRMFVKLQYCDLFNLTVATTFPWSGGIGQTFQSSLFDPDYTSVIGNQPMYYDQLIGAGTGPYLYYRVFGVGYDFEFVNTNTSQAMPCCIHFTDVAAPLPITTKNEWIRVEEQPGVRRVSIGPSSSKPTKVKGYMSVAKTLGVKPITVKVDDRFRATYNTNPADMAYINIYITSGNASSANVCQVRAKLTYYAELSGLLNQALS